MPSASDVSEGGRCHPRIKSHCKAIARVTFHTQIDRLERIPQTLILYDENNMVCAGLVGMVPYQEPHVVPARVANDDITYVER